MRICRRCGGEVQLSAIDPGDQRQICDKCRADKRQADRCCVDCGGEVEQPGSGRPRKRCDDCAAREHRRQRAAQARRRRRRLAQQKAAAKLRQERRIA